MRRAPTGADRLRWLGPGFLWMVSAAGSGELLFTPRVGAQYGYALLWALLAAVALKWFVNREIGRHTVATGRTLLDGASRLPGPRHWAVGLIVVPQLVVAVATIAGLAASAATALILVLPGDIRIWTVGSIVASTALVAVGRYAIIERVATIIAVALGAAAVAAAVSVGPSAADLVGGLEPQIPDDFALREVLPWLGFMLSGAAGMVWYSQWLQSKGYGAAGTEDSASEGDGAGDHDVERLRGWVKQMTLDNSVAVVGTLVITIAFLVLGAELLRPEGIVPEEDRVADVLGRLLGDVWGRAGFWFMVLAVFVGFWDTVLSDQDGFARMFGEGGRLLTGRLALASDKARRSIAVTLLAAAPTALYLVAGEPVALLRLAGVVEAAQIPLVAVIALALNRQLPPGLRPSKLSIVGTSTAAAFFASFALVYVAQLLGVV